MPNDNIDRAIKKGTGELGGGQLEKVTYEGYGPGGVAIIVDVLTDNRNRVVAELRFIFSRHGGNLGESGCVAWMFKQAGMIAVEKGAVDEDRLIELALEAGAEDVVQRQRRLSSADAAREFRRGARGAGKGRNRRSPRRSHDVPENTVKVSGHPAEQVLKLMEEIEDHEDVQSVSANFDIDDEEMAHFSAA